MLSPFYFKKEDDYLEIMQYLTKVNYAKTSNKQNKYIVIHYTANNGDTAQGNASYFNSVIRYASANYFVDENGIVQVVKDTDIAWHCESKGMKLLTPCRNKNSIGIEMCSRKDASGKYYIKQETVDNAIELTKLLMKKYNIPIENVIRHFDCCGKNCPEPFVRDENLWIKFKEKLTDSNITDVKEKENMEEEEDMIKYNYTLEVPEWAKPTIQKLLDKKYLTGDDKGKLGLNDTMLKVFVINDRAGLYN